MKRLLVCTMILIATSLQAREEPQVEFAVKNDKCSKNCAKRLKIGKYSKSYSSKSNLEHKAIYNGRAWALISDVVRRRDGKKGTEKLYFLHSTDVRRPHTLEAACAGRDRDISYRGQLVCLYKDKVLVQGSHVSLGKQEYPLPEKLVTGVVSHNKNGDLSVAMISAEDHSLSVNSLHRLRNGQSWFNSPTSLHARSDLNDIMDVKTFRRSGFVASVYEWINPEVKGLTIYFFDQDGNVKRGNREASITQNIGFNPTLHERPDGVSIHAENSSLRERQTFYYSTKELASLEYWEFENAQASLVEFMAGAGAQQAFWSADQSVEIDGETITTTLYDMNTNILASYFVQGRWGNSQLAVTMLQNKAEDEVEGLTNNEFVQEAVNKYIVQYDYDGLFDGSSTLRLGYSTLDAGGVATFEQDGDSVERVFENRKERYEALVMMERGFFAGAYYSEMGAPGLVGYGSSTGQYLGAAYDKSASLRQYGLTLGFDEAAYGSRYEMDYSRFYLSLAASVGLARLSVSRDSLMAVSGQREGDIHGRNTFAWSAAGEFGYIWQSRMRSLRRLGASLQLGYRIDYEHVHANWDSEDEFEEDGWYVNYKRSDLIHGPYARVNILF